MAVGDLMKAPRSAMLLHLLHISNELDTIIKVHEFDKIYTTKVNHKWWPKWHLETK